MSEAFQECRDVQQPFKELSSVLRLRQSVYSKFQPKETRKEMRQEAKVSDIIRTFLNYLPPSPPTRLRSYLYYFTGYRLRQRRSPERLVRQFLQSHNSRPSNPQPLIRQPPNRQPPNSRPSNSQPSNSQASNRQPPNSRPANRSPSNRQPPNRQPLNRRRRRQCSKLSPGFRFINRATTLFPLPFYFYFSSPPSFTPFTFFSAPSRHCRCLPTAMYRLATLKRNWPTSDWRRRSGQTGTPSELFIVVTK